MSRLATSFTLAVGLFSAIPSVTAQRVQVLRDVKAIQVDPTVVANPEKVKEDFAARLELRSRVRER